MNIWMEITFGISLYQSFLLCVHGQANHTGGSRIFIGNMIYMSRKQTYYNCLSTLSQLPVEMMVDMHSDL